MTLGKIVNGIFAYVAQRTQTLDAWKPIVKTGTFIRPLKVSTRIYSLFMGVSIPPLMNIYQRSYVGIILHQHIKISFLRRKNIVVSD